MKWISRALVLPLLLIAVPSVAMPDSSYIQPFAQKYALTAFVARNSLQLHANDKAYVPNSPVSLGFGCAIKNTFINLRQGIPVWQPGTKAGGDTRSFDLQLHQYSRYFIADLFYQEYKGFYYKEKNQDVFTNMYIRQAGLSGTYIFRGNRFSAKAAFEQSEQQLRSAGSWVMGGNLFVSQLQDLQSLGKGSIDNIQLGAQFGYTYTYVINPRWQLTGMAMTGISLGNEWALTRKGQLNAYPIAMMRGAASYHQPNWSLYWSMLLQNRSVYPDKAQQLSLMAINMQVAYVRRFHSLKLRRSPQPLTQTRQ
jgi:hypothetical protein